MRKSRWELFGRRRWIVNQSKNHTLGLLLIVACVMSSLFVIDVGRRCSRNGYFRIWLVGRLYSRNEEETENFLDGRRASNRRVDSCCFLLLFAFHHHSTGTYVIAAVLPAVQTNHALPTHYLAAAAPLPSGVYNVYYSSQGAASPLNYQLSLLKSGTYV